MEKISVIVPTHNGAVRLEGLLESLAAQRGPCPDWELVVVNNRSSDRTGEAAQTFFAAHPRWNACLVSEPRLGKSLALNTGIRAAQGEILAFLDDDVTVQDDWLACLAKAFADPETACVGGRILPAWRGAPPRWFSPGVACFTPIHDLGEAPVPYRPPASLPVGANMAARRRAVDKAGLFDARLGIFGQKVAGGEEADLCLRMHGLGMRLVYEPPLVAFHPFDGPRLGKACLRRRALVQGMSTGYYMKKSSGSLYRLLAQNAAHLLRGGTSGSRAAGESLFFYELKAILYLAYGLGLAFGPVPVTKIPLS